jgi:Secretion system C-terminal sorting domain
MGDIMKYFYTVLLIILVYGQLIGQNKLLVSPDNEAIPIHKGQNAAEIIAGVTKSRMSTADMTCPNSLIFGYPDYSIDVSFAGYHREVVAMWFVAPTTGTIDTIFWEGLTNGIPDSLVYIQIRKSNIGPNSGPGVDYPDACTNWGYYPNTNDPDKGVGAFPEDSTGNWVSTLDLPYVSYPPVGELLWGGTTGVGVVHREGMNKMALSDYWGPLNVSKGDTFFITFKIPPYTHTNDDPCCPTRFGTSTSVPFNRIWKFYEHDRAGCNGPRTNGWFMREFGVYNWWFSVTPSVNVAPLIGDFTTLTNTFSTDPLVVDAEILDCDYGNPGEAGIASAVIKWSANFVDQPDIVMSHTSGNMFRGEIPNIPGRIFYSIKAGDTKGLFSQAKAKEFNIARTKNKWYTLDIGIPYNEKNISTTGTSIDPSEFFHNNDPSLAADDGTAGPFDIGGPFVFNGDTVRYVWVGVNGAIALTSSETDTQDINPGGIYTNDWSIPNGLQHNGRSDIAGEAGIPKNFISILGADLLLNDGDVTYGKIMHQQGFEGDTCLFIVEWDSVGTWWGDPVSDITTFRAILNRCTGSIEFQYKNIGTYEQDLNSLVGIEKDSSGIYPGDWLFICKNGYPSETRPRDAFSMRLVYDTAQAVITYNTTAGWNLMSIPLTVSDYRKSVLFPTATSDAFMYYGSYTAEDTLRNGYGYWLKYGNDTTFLVDDYKLVSVTVDVLNGWNMLGSLSYAIPVINIGSNPPHMITSDFFGYNGNYFVADSIKPGIGYWVKVNGGGQLILSMSIPITSSNRIRIVHTDEMPPLPPKDDELIMNRTLPNVFALEQNYPNPFNPTTLIEYALPTDEHVRLSIYNMLGQEVAQLVNDIQKAGYKRITFNAGNLPSGLYFYRLMAGKYTQIKKMILIK